jgi:dihydrofolate reductase
VLYRDAIQDADKMIVTQVNKEYDGDTYFPEYRDDIGKTWIETDRRETEELTFLVYKRA